MSGAFTAVAGVAHPGIQLSGPWADYRYTPESSRAFCTLCGSRLWFRSDLWPGELFLNVGVLADPQAHRPDQHVMWRQAVPWGVTRDDIPVSQGFQRPVAAAPQTSDPLGLSGQGSAPLAGHCLCGQVRWQAEAAPLWSGHCHCTSCRRATGAPFSSFLWLPHGQVAWSGQMTGFASSGGRVTRHFCTTCGTHMRYHSADHPAEIRLYAASMADPSRFHPAAHIHETDRLPWLVLADDLPRHAALPNRTEPTRPC